YHRRRHARYRRALTGKEAARASSRHQRALSFGLHGRYRHHPRRARSGHRLSAETLHPSESRRESPRGPALPIRTGISQQVNREIGFELTSLPVPALALASLPPTPLTSLPVTPLQIAEKLKFRIRASLSPGGTTENSPAPYSLRKKSVSYQGIALAMP